jgi:hypothetical protein
MRPASFTLDDVLDLRYKNKEHSLLNVVSSNAIEIAAGQLNESR